LNDELGGEAARWNFVEAWPTKDDPSDLNAKGNDIAIETLEVAHEGMVRVK
jgi:phage tail-like protein